MNNHKQVQLIVSRCIGDRIVGNRMVDLWFDTKDEAISFGECFRKKNFSIVIRPNYNVVDEDGEFFREWRSFNGEMFKEVRFGFKNQVSW